MKDFGTPKPIHVPGSHCPACSGGHGSGHGVSSEFLSGSTPGLVPRVSPRPILLGEAKIRGNPYGGTTLAELGVEQVAPTSIPGTVGPVPSQDPQLTRDAFERTFQKEIESGQKLDPEKLPEQWKGTPERFKELAKEQNDALSRMATLTKDLDADEADTRGKAASEMRGLAEKFPRTFDKFAREAVATASSGEVKGRLSTIRRSALSGPLYRFLKAVATRDDRDDKRLTYPQGSTASRKDFVEMVKKELDSLIDKVPPPVASEDLRKKLKLLSERAEMNLELREKHKERVLQEYWDEFAEEATDYVRSEHLRSRQTSGPPLTKEEQEALEASEEKLRRGPDVESTDKINRAIKEKLESKRTEAEKKKKQEDDKKKDEEKKEEGRMERPLTPTLGLARTRYEVLTPADLEARRREQMTSTRAAASSSLISLALTLGPSGATRAPTATPGAAAPAPSPAPSPVPPPSVAT